ncbi:hypothetical protein ACWEQL_15795 [Kitasatospora sp. NPDC004240]
MYAPEPARPADPPHPAEPPRTVEPPRTAGRPAGSAYTAEPSHPAGSSESSGTSGPEDELPPSVMSAAGPEGWDFVMYDFSDTPKAPPAPIPEQRTAPEEESAAAEPGGASDGKPGKAAGRPGPGRPAKAERSSGPGVLTGRRPSPLLLLSSGVLVGGAVTGLMLVMLAGWGVGYLSRQLSDFTRKFAVLGIPLMTMSATTLWFWGRADGRWGEALRPGQQVGAETWAAAPLALRVAAVLSAVFLLAVAMRRRGAAAGG